MIESLVGVAVPATRQNCGRLMFVVHPVAPVVQPGGVLNVPPVMVWAAVICPWGKDRLARPSHVVAAGAAVAPSKTAANDTLENTIGFKRRLMSVSSHIFIWSGTVAHDAGRVLRTVTPARVSRDQPSAEH
jgi:hypothetical protein